MKRMGYEIDDVHIIEYIFILICVCFQLMSNWNAFWTHWILVI